MNEETEELRIRRAQKLAYEEGRRRQAIDGRLDNHEARLDAVNGSIDRGTQATSGLRVEIRKLREEFSVFIQEQYTRDKVERTRTQERKEAEDRRVKEQREREDKRNKAIHEATRKQVTSRQLYVAVALIVATILVGIYAKSHWQIGLILMGLL